MDRPRFITKPGLWERLREVRSLFDHPEADGAQLTLERLRPLLVEQGEWDFEQLVANHPWGVLVPQLLTQLDLPPEIQSWLDERLDPKDYMAMPNGAMGKYKDRCNWIYFKDRSMAMLFKLTWG